MKSANLILIASCSLSSVLHSKALLGCYGRDSAVGGVTGTFGLNDATLKNLSNQPCIEWFNNNNDDSMPIFLTIEDWDYHVTVYNWILHMEKLGLRSYIVGCYDEIPTPQQARNTGSS
jgi:hypothetical protein